MCYLHRTIEPVIKEVSEIFKVVLLTGSRQSGKSTCMAHLSEHTHRERLNLDNETLLSQAKGSAELFLSKHKFPLFIDEIQRAPNLFLQIKAKVDEIESYGQVWASGSQKFALMKGVADSLAGRICPLNLMPLSLYERFGEGLKQKPYLPSKVPSDILQSANKEDLWKIIWQGAWPRVIDMNSRQRRFFYEGLVQTYLQRDIFTEAGVEKLAEYKKFLRELALRTGQELRIGSLAKSVGVNEKTIKSWLSVAEASELIYFLNPYNADIGKQLVKSSRVYFMDTGLAAFLIGFETPKAMSYYTSAEAFFKTFVITEILKSWVHNGLSPSFYFYRDSKTQQEIDLLIRSEGKLYPVEVKLSARPKKDAIKNFSVLKDLPEKIGQGAVICTSEIPYGLTDDVMVHSVWEI